MYTWNPKQPFFNGCLVKQACFMSRFGIIELEQSLKLGCLGYQAPGKMLKVSTYSCNARDGEFCPQDVGYVDLPPKTNLGSLKILPLGLSKKAVLLFKPFFSRASLLLVSIR